MIRKKKKHALKPVIPSEEQEFISVCRSLPTEVRSQRKRDVRSAHLRELMIPLCEEVLLDSFNSHTVFSGSFSGVLFQKNR